MDIKKEFAIRLKLLREEKNLSQAELADKLGMSRGSISFYENCDRTPDIEFLEKASDFFEVSYNFLLGKSEFRSSDVAVEEICLKTGLSAASVILLEHINKNKQDNVYFTLIDLMNYFGSGTDSMWITIDKLVKIPKYQKSVELTDIEMYYIGSLYKRISEMVDNIRDKLDKDNKLKENFRALRMRNEEKIKKMVEDFEKGGGKNGKHNETNE